MEKKIQTRAILIGAVVLACLFGIIGFPRNVQELQANVRDRIRLGLAALSACWRSSALERRTGHRNRLERRTRRSARRSRSRFMGPGDCGECPRSCAHSTAAHGMGSARPRCRPPAVV